MLSLLISSSDKKTREEYALTYSREKDIADVDILFFDKDTIIKKDTKSTRLSIGIEDVRQIYPLLFLKPIKSNLKAIIVRDAQLLTLEAQNGMLKLLEEPPRNTIIILTADTKESFVATILSRCQIIEIPEVKKIFDEKEKIHRQIETLQSLSVAESLELAESLAKNRKETVIWLENMIIVLREELLRAIKEDSDEKKAWYAYIVAQFQKTCQIVKTTNINLRFVLENLFLSILMK